MRIKMQNFLDRIKSGKIITADGAMGSLLFQRGLKPGQCPEALNLSNPEILEEIAQLYFEAGAEIVQTNTFGGSPLKLAEYKLEDQASEINKKAVVCVRKSIGDKAYLSGSCGPSGKLLLPFGDTEPEALTESFAVQMAALIEAGADIICVETMTDINEAVIAVQAAKKISPQIPVMATMTFNQTPNGFYSAMGNSISDAALQLQEAGADIIGSNCGNGIDNMVMIAEEFSKSTELPIIIQSNAGLPELVSGEMAYPETPSFFAEKVQVLKEAGVSIIGGCCGTTPEHIRAIRKAVDHQNG